MTRSEAVLVLSDGTLFEGEAVGALKPGDVASGEVVFNTALSGYQEVVTDPSYAGQIIAFTYPHIGNYGVNDGDDESSRPRCRGVIVRDLARRSSSWRAQGDLDGFLKEHGVPALTGIDTRRLARHLRDAGALPGAFGMDESAVRAAARTARGTDGIDLVAEVTTEEPYVVGGSDARFRVVAYDFGIKVSILRGLEAVGCQVEVVPASTTAADVLARAPDGVFLSNGPGDPAALGAGPRGRFTPRRGTGVWHLPRASGDGARARRDHDQAAVRPPRREPSGAPRGNRAASRSPARTTTTSCRPTRCPVAPTSPT